MDNQEPQQQNKSYDTLKKGSSKLLKGALALFPWKTIALVGGALLAVAMVMMMLLILFAAAGGSDCSPVYESGSGRPGEGVVSGDWKDKKSQKYKDMKYAADRFKDELGMSGANIAAALSEGIRESQFDPKAHNPSGEVKGIWQWGYGTTNGNRYKDTADTVEAQVSLAIKELKTTHSRTLVDMKNADIDGSVDAWATHFEGLPKGDKAQRKHEETVARAREIQKFFELNFDGNIKADDADTNVESTGSSTDECETGRGSTSTGLPIEGAYNITGGYPNYQGSNGSQHYGVDFQTISQYQDAAHVYSVHDGKVFKVGYDDTGGWHIIIQGDDGVYSYYGHAPSKSAIVVKQGQKVKKGQHISKQGETGLATGVHVHFATNRNKEAVTSGAGFQPEAEGIFSPGDYLKNLPKKVIPKKDIVTTGGPFNVKTHYG